MTHNESQNLEKSDIFILRLIKGDLGLVVTFWGFWFCGNLIFLAIRQFMMSNWMEIVQGGNEYVFDIYDWFCYAYLVLIWISLWNSAVKYKGRFWGTITMILVCLGVVATVGRVLSGSESGTSNLMRLNSGLPRMIDSDTEFKSIIALPYGMGVHYDFRLVNFDINDIDKHNLNEFIEALRDKLKNTVCSDREQMQVIGQYGRIHFVYSDRNSARMADISFSKDDCVKP